MFCRHKHRACGLGGVWGVGSHSHKFYSKSAPTTCRLKKGKEFLFYSTSFTEITLFSVGCPSSTLRNMFYTCIFKHFPTRSETGQNIHETKQNTSSPCSKINHPQLFTHCYFIEKMRLGEVEQPAQGPTIGWSSNPVPSDSRVQRLVTPKGGKRRQHQSQSQRRKVDGGKNEIELNSAHLLATCPCSRPPINPEAGGFQATDMGKAGNCSLWLFVKELQTMKLEIKLEHVSMETPVYKMLG